MLIVGAGLTGSLTAAILKKNSLPLTVTVWDKAYDAGGRTSTHRDPGNPGLCVDMGAQYISRAARIQSQDANQEYECLRECLYEDLLSSNVLSPFCGLIEGEKKHLTTSIVQNYVSPQGLNNIVKHFLTQSGAEVVFQQHVTGVHRNVDDKDGSQVLCVTSDRERTFDGVILTLPVPQLISLRGSIFAELDTKTLANLNSVTYSSRYALGLFYDDAITRPEAWSAKYFDDPVVRFAAWDTAKRGCPLRGSSLLLHTSVPFGIEHMEDDREVVKELISHKAVELIPGLQHFAPVHSHLKRWRYSQVFQVYPGSPGCVVLSRNPLVVATGDGFSGSNFENCIRAAQSTVKEVIKNMT